MRRAVLDGVVTEVLQSSANTALAPVTFDGRIRSKGKTVSVKNAELLERFRDDFVQDAGFDLNNHATR